MTAQRARLIVADDHLVIVEGISNLLLPSYEIVGTARDGRELIEAAQRLKPDVILLDISMPRMNGIEAARRVRRLLPATKIVILSMHSEPAYVREALRAGASGYVVKTAGSTEVIKAVEEVLQGRYYITPELAAIPTDVIRQARSARHTLPGELTPRQREILQLVAEGRGAREIAAVLEISMKTVEFHKSAIMSRLNLRSIAALTRYALEHGISG